MKADDTIVITEQSKEGFDGSLHVIKKTVSSKKTGHEVCKEKIYDKNNPVVREGNIVAYKQTGMNKTLVQ